MPDDRGLQQRLRASGLCAAIGPAPAPGTFGYMCSLDAEPPHRTHVAEIGGRVVDTWVS